jgi:hypothetical protein
MEAFSIRYSLLSKKQECFVNAKDPFTLPLMIQHAIRAYIIFLIFNLKLKEHDVFNNLLKRINAYILYHK